MESSEGACQMFGSQAKTLWDFWDGLGVGSDAGKTRCTDQGRWDVI